MKTCGAVGRSSALATHGVCCCDSWGRVVEWEDKARNVAEKCGHDGSSCHTGVREAKRGIKTSQVRLVPARVRTLLYVSLQDGGVGKGLGLRSGTPFICSAILSAMCVRWQRTSRERAQAHSPSLSMVRSSTSCYCGGRRLSVPPPPTMRPRSQNQL